MQIYSNKDTYIGEFKEGLRSGKGSFKYSNGDMYDGEWLSGM
jgi:radial spoke head protein 1